MADKTYTDKALKQLFKQLPEEQLPRELDAGILLHIQKTEKASRRKNLWGIWCAVSLASIAVIFLPIGIFRYLSIDALKMFKDIFPPLSETAGHFPSLAVIVGAAAILLLFIDNRLRKFFLR